MSLPGEETDFNQVAIIKLQEGLAISAVNIVSNITSDHHRNKNGTVRKQNSRESPGDDLH
jgi:hypothetical protein